jgi:hypothetical protein
MENPVYFHLLTALHLFLSLLPQRPVVPRRATDEAVPIGEEEGVTQTSLLKRLYL